MDRFEEWRELCQKCQRHPNSSKEQINNVELNADRKISSTRKFILKSNQLVRTTARFCCALLCVFQFDRILSYETILRNSYEGFIGIHRFYLFFFCVDFNLVFRFLPDSLIKANKIVEFTEHQRRLFIEETALFISSIAKEIQELNYQMEILVFEIHSNNGKMFYQQIVSQLLVVRLITP
jgi:hypothetical protein